MPTFARAIVVSMVWRHTSPPRRCVTSEDTLGAEVVRELGLQASGDQTAIGHGFVHAWVRAGRQRQALVRQVVGALDLDRGDAGQKR